MVSEAVHAKAVQVHDLFCSDTTCGPQTMGAYYNFARLMMEAQQAQRAAGLQTDTKEHERMQKKRIHQIEADHPMSLVEVRDAILELFAETEDPTADLRIFGEHGQVIKIVVTELA